MIERLREYDAEVVECTPAGTARRHRRTARRQRQAHFCRSPGLPAAWKVAGFDWKIDHGLPPPRSKQAEGVVTAAFCGVADSGTIVLHHSATEGRRVLTLLPDWHLCILRASQVVETLPEYFTAEQPPALATYISGPSATADIEMTRIKGVHGPRFLHVILVRDEFRSTAQNFRPGKSARQKEVNHDAIRIRNSSTWRLQALDSFQIEIPSWGFANTGTRFGKFVQAAAASTIEEKFADAAEVNRLTGVTPTLALHVLWDLPNGLKPMCPRSSS
jgi:L-lactate dehydrogenase complex protein LldG